MCNFPLQAQYLIGIAIEIPRPQRITLVCHDQPQTHAQHLSDLLQAALKRMGNAEALHELRRIRSFRRGPSR